MAPTAWIQLGSLIVSAFALVYLIKYAGYTKAIAEGTLKPAVIATQTGIITNPPQLRNIGSGPALDVEWTLGTKKSVKISYIEPGHDSDPLTVDLQKLEPAAVQSGTNKATIKCSYRGISGTTYHSVSSCDFNTGHFSTA